MGTGQVFAIAVTEFTDQYADQNEADPSQLLEAIESGRVTVEDEG